MTVRSIRVAALTGLLLFAGQLAAVADKYTETFAQTYEVAHDVEISLGNTNGNVIVEIWDQESVEVVAEKRVNARDSRTASEAFDKVRIEVTQSAGQLEIDTEYPKGPSGFFDWLSGRSSNASVRYELRVPRGAGLTIRTVNGNVSTIGTEGTQHLRTTNGRIEVEKAHHVVDAHTTNGSIDVGLTAGARDPEIELGTTNGSIRLHLPGDVRASLQARTVNGKVSTEIPISITGSASKKRISAELNGGGSGRIVLRTTNGSIRILEATA